MKTLYCDTEVNYTVFSEQTIESETQKSDYGSADQ